MFRYFLVAFQAVHYVFKSFSTGNISQDLAFLESSVSSFKIVTPLSYDKWLNKAYDFHTRVVSESLDKLWDGISSL